MTKSPGAPARHGIAHRHQIRPHAPGKARPRIDPLASLRKLYVDNHGVG